MISDQPKEGNEMAIAEEAIGFAGLMPTEILAVGFPDQAKLLIVLELVLKKPHIVKKSGKSTYGQSCAQKHEGGFSFLTTFVTISATGLASKFTKKLYPKEYLQWYTSFVVGHA